MKQVEVSLARNARDVYDCLKLRKTVFVDQYQDFSQTADLMFDEYDTFPGTHLFLAKMDGKAVGTLRLTDGQYDGLSPVDDSYCFTPMLNQKKYATGSMLCCTKNSMSHHIAHMLVLTAYIYFYCNNVEYCVACVNPKAWPLFKSFAFKKVDEQLVCSKIDRPFFPIMVDKEGIYQMIEPLIPSIQSFHSKDTIEFSINNTLELKDSEGIMINFKRKMKDRRQEACNNVSFERRRENRLHNGILNDRYHVLVPGEYQSF